MEKWGRLDRTTFLSQLASALLDMPKCMPSMDRGVELLVIDLAAFVASMKVMVVVVLNSGASPGN